jgi:hypothetical protein
MSDDLSTWSGRALGALEIVHVPGYFSPECREEYKAIGVHPSLAYFPARAAAMGAVPAEVVEATFYVFAPAAVRLVMPQCWDAVTPAQVLEARHRGVSRTLHRLLDPVVDEVGSEALAEAVKLARRACEGLTAPGHPLYAGHASLPWPDDPQMQLWHAASLLREHRGDGHVAALVSHGVGPIEAMVTSLLAGSLVSERFLRRSRGWTDEQWDDARRGLVERGLLEPDGGHLTAAGEELRRSVESSTDRAARCGWDLLGVDGTRELAQILRPFATAVVDSGILASSRGGA